MGVKGLTTMIEHHSSLFQKCHLRDVRLVIDGYALLFYLYYDRPLCDDGHHGGRYQRFAAKCHLFFLNLDKCNISPSLVFDGALEKDDKKLTETKSRSSERIRTGVAIAGGSGGIAVSPCVVLVFMRVLDDLKIPYAFCDFEADAETAALANAWDCPAASKDSDFYIMDVRAGYLPLNYLDWKNPKKVKTPEAGAQFVGRRSKKGDVSSSDQLYIECMKYKVSTLCKMFHVKQALLPVLATAIGNDYKDTFGASLDPFQRFIHSQFSRSKSRNKSYNQIISCLSWLRAKDTVEDAIIDMVKHVRGGDRVKLRQLIEASLEMYRVSTSVTLVQFCGGQENPTQSKLAECTSVPLWFVALLNRGKVSALCANVLCNKRVFLQIQVEDPLKHSAGAASVQIRSVLYGILLGEQKSISRRPPVVEEYAQWRGKLQHSIVEPVYEIDRGNETKLALPSLQDIPAMHENDRRELLLATLGIDGSVLDGIPGLFQMAFCVTLYLIHHADPSLHSDKYLALVISWLHGVAVSRQKYISKGQTTPEYLQVGLENSDVHALLVNCKHYGYRKPDVEVIQTMAQWQQCMLDLVNLNKVLLSPCPCPDMALLYDGPLIHNICFLLKMMGQTDDRQWVEFELLSGTRPTVRALFHQLLQPSWHLLKPKKQTKKKKKGKRVTCRRAAVPSSVTPVHQSERDAQCDADEDNVELVFGVSVFSRFETLDSLDE